jgi:hypothetical protein
VLLSWFLTKKSYMKEAAFVIFEFIKCNQL